MKNKGKLKRAERLEISILLKKEYSFREIAEALERSPNTISYEIKNNSVNWEYDPLKAHAKARHRKRMSKFQWKKIEENKELKKYIIQGLKDCWNPDEIAGRMKEENKSFYASKTAIYDCQVPRRREAEKEMERKFLVLLRRFSLRKEHPYFITFVCSFLRPHGDRGAPVSAFCGSSIGRSHSFAGPLRCLLRVHSVASAMFVISYRIDLST